MDSKRVLYCSEEPKFHNKWRPAMAWSYMIICLFDFMVAPIFYPLIQGAVITSLTSVAQWEPMTLKAGGLYHLSMLAIVGVTAYGRTREKLASIPSELDFEFSTKRKQESEES